MKAQKLYDFREETEFCSGSDLQDFFLQETGEYSPSGNTEIDNNRATEFVESQLRVMAYNSLSLVEYAGEVASKFKK